MLIRHFSNTLRIIFGMIPQMLPDLHRDSLAWCVNRLHHIAILQSPSITTLPGVPPFQKALAPQC